MIRTVPATKVKSNFGQIIRLVYAEGDHVIVEKGNIPVVAIIPISDYAMLKSHQVIAPEVSEKIRQGSRLVRASRQLRQARGEESNVK